MSLRLTLLKAAINISIALAIPEAVIFQGLSSASLDFLVDFYEDKKEKKDNSVAHKLTKLYEKYFSEKYFAENDISYEKADYFKSQIIDILKYSETSIPLLAEYKKDAVALCDYMVTIYKDNCLCGILENEKDIRKIIIAILPEMIEIICAEPGFLLDGILTLYLRVDKNEKEINDLKRCVELLQQKSIREETLLPQFITDPPYALTHYFVGREKIVEEVLTTVINKQAVLIYGIGGIGKTEIAKRVINLIVNEPCNRYGIEKIAWIDYDNENIRTCITRGLLATSQITDENEAWAYTLGMISNIGKRLLLVIDNVEQLNDENLLRLTQLPCKILLTSRIRELTNFSVLEIEHLSKEDCIILFEKYYTKQPDSLRTIEKIVGLADYHTVTIELLAKIANLEECSLAQFLERLKLLGFNLSDEEVTANHEKLHKEEKIIQQLAKLFSIVHLTAEEASLIVPISVIPSMTFSYKNARQWFGQKNHKNFERLVNTGWLQDASRSGGKYYMIHSVIASAIRFQYKEV